MAHTRTQRNSDGYVVRLHDDDCGIGCDAAAESFMRHLSETVSDVARIVQYGKGYMIDQGHDPDFWTFDVTRNMADGSAVATVAYNGKGRK